MTARNGTVIYIRRRQGSDLICVRKVDHGFDRASAADFREKLGPLIRKSQPYSMKIQHRTKPELLAEMHGESEPIEIRKQT